MDSVWNDGSVEEFYLVLLDRRLDYSVRICRWESFCLLCILAAVEECKCTLYLVIKYPSVTSSVDWRSSFSWQKGQVGLNNVIQNTSLYSYWLDVLLYYFSPGAWWRERTFRTTRVRVLRVRIYECRSWPCVWAPVESVLCQHSRATR